MQQSTVKQLYAYWDRVRNGRIAPHRLEIEPREIAPILSETFIAECIGPRRYRFRLAGTKICENFTQELRGQDLLSFWDGDDRESMTALLGQVFGEARTALARFRAHSVAGRSCDFDLLLLPLTSSGRAIDRCLGAVAATEWHFWLGMEPLRRLQLVEVANDWTAPADRPLDASPVVSEMPVAALREHLQRQFPLRNGDNSGGQ